MLTLQGHLLELVENWDRLPIRVFQDGKWQSLFLSEINDGQQILDWIKETEDRFWISVTSELLTTYNAAKQKKVTLDHSPSS